MRLIVSGGLGIKGNAESVIARFCLSVILHTASVSKSLSL